MRILLFGRNGQVAHTLREEAEGKFDLVICGSKETDLSRAHAAANSIRAHKPDIIINAAAFTAVDKAESETGLAARLNEAAVAEMAEAARDINAHFIHLSTDYVFDGKSETSYSEKSAVNPLNIYGASKRAGEKAALSANPQTIILRTSWVFSEYGANFVKTMLSLSRERDQLNIVGDQIGGPTAARDIAKAALTIAAKKHRGAPGAGVYHYQGAPSLSWADFARKIFDYSGRKTTVASILTSDYPTPAPRPLRTILDCARIERDFGLAQPDWRIALRQVIDALNQKGMQP